MTTTRLLYIFDPLCGWCYASAPALEELVRLWPNQLEMLPSGLFSEAGARDLTPDWADYAWTNDQRIEAMTGQVFSEAYHQKVLLGNGLRFDSAMINRALTLVHAIDMTLESRALHQLQIARYVQGLDTASACVVGRITAQVMADAGHAADESQVIQRLETDTALVRSTQARTKGTQALMSELGVRGVPQLLLCRGGVVRAVSSAALYQGGEMLVNEIRELLRRHEPSVPSLV